MSVLSEQNVAVLFTTSDPETGAATDADALPVGTLHRNGEATEDVVQITKAQTGLYKVAVSLPECDPGDMLSISVSATVGGVVASAVVWEDTVQMAVPVASVGADAIDYDSLATGAVNRIWEFLVADETSPSVVMHALNSIDLVAPRLLSMIEADDASYRFTEAALAEAPTGGGGGATAQDVWEYATRSLTDKAGFSLATAPPTATDNATAVWEAEERTLTDFGPLLDAIEALNNLSQDDVTEAVWYTEFVEELVQGTAAALLDCIAKRLGSGAQPADADCLIGSRHYNCLPCSVPPEPDPEPDNGDGDGDGDGDEILD